MANEPREYRKGNWMVEETMILIEAKKMDDERRLMIRHGESSSSERGKPGELRWKRVEDYCWKNGCFRSQNQCNDKWDNLMRDFKKVREYQRRVAAERGGGGDCRDNDKSYWKMDKNHRKEQSLPSNMLPQIFDALVQVVERKSTAAATVTGAVSAATPPVGGGGFGIGSPSFQHNIPQQGLDLPVLPLPPPTQQPPPPSFPTAGTSDSGSTDSPAKRRRSRGGDSGSSSSGLQQVCSAISQSGSMIVEAIQSREEREERRHREVVRLHERRLQIEESNAQINRQGFNAIVDAINKLANSIIALASHRNPPGSK